MLKPENRIAGVLAPLFALRSRDDLGIGDVDTLREFVDWAARHELALVQILPVNETGADNSPYNAISALALEPCTLATRPGRVPGLTPPLFQEICQKYDLDLMRQASVDYPQVKALKHELLGAAYSQWSEDEADSNSAEFAQFREENQDWLPGYSFFRVLMQRNGNSEVYDQWPAQHQKIATAREWFEALDPAQKEAFQAQQKYFEWVQWVAFTQWRDVAAYAAEREVALMGDIPVGVSYYSADVYLRPQDFRLNWSGGAPPEKIFEADKFTEMWGQNWGVPMYRWERMESRGFPWWRRRVSLTASIFQAVRIDHILGLFRMYAFPWRPEKNAEVLEMSHDEILHMTKGRLPQFLDNPDSTQIYRDDNREKGLRRLRMILEAAGGSIIVGEDLGEVPDYVRPALLEAHVPGFRIPHWEIDYSNGLLIDPEHYDRFSMTTWATHDHDPLKTQWNAWVTRAEQTEDHDKAAAARWELHRVCEIAGIELQGFNEYPAYNPEVQEKLFRVLFRSNAWMAVGMITDFFAGEKRFNVPGSVATSNWSARLDHTVDEFDQDDHLRRRMERISTLIRETGRTVRQPEPEGAGA